MSSLTIESITQVKLDVKLYCEALMCYGPYPRKDREEGEGDGCPGSIPSLPQRVVLRISCLPLVCQEAETHKPHEGPKS